MNSDTCRTERLNKLLASLELIREFKESKAKMDDGRNRAYLDEDDPLVEEYMSKYQKVVSHVEKTNSDLDPFEINELMSTFMDVMNRK